MAGNVAGRVLFLLAMAAVDPLFAGGRFEGIRAAGTSSAASSSVTATRQFCDALWPITEQKGRRRLFGLVQKDPYDEGRWMEFKSDPELDAMVKAQEGFEFAEVWSRDDGAVALSMELTPASKDWFIRADYCFRSDGTLARVNATLTTLSAFDEDPMKNVLGAIRERDRYFDAGGKQVRVTQRVLDLARKPAPTLQLMDHEEPIYERVTALPFFELLMLRSRK